MLCYLDKTFCGSATHKPDCANQITPAQIEAAKKWWKGPNPPIAFSNFCSVDFDPSIYEEK